MTNFRVVVQRSLVHNNVDVTELVGGPGCGLCTSHGCDQLPLSGVTEASSTAVMSTISASWVLMKAALFAWLGLKGPPTP